MIISNIRITDNRKRGEYNVRLKSKSYFISENNTIS